MKNEKITKKEQRSEQVKSINIPGIACLAVVIALLAGCVYAAYRYGLYMPVIGIITRSLIGVGLIGALIFAWRIYKSRIYGIVEALLVTVVYCAGWQVTGSVFTKFSVFATSQPLFVAFMVGFIAAFISGSKKAWIGIAGVSLVCGLALWLGTGDTTTALLFGGVLIWSAISSQLVKGIMALTE